MRLWRSARTGEFVSKAAAEADPDTTVEETTIQRSLTDIGRRLATIQDRAIGVDGSEAYAADPGYWQAEAAAFLAWLHG